MSQDFYHPPMPYVVVLRVRLTEDAAPDRFESKQMAYSVYEAMMQALVEVQGVANVADSKYVVERVSPDMDAFRAMMTDLVVKTTKKT